MRNAETTDKNNTRARAYKKIYKLISAKEFWSVVCSTVVATIISTLVINFVSLHSIEEKEHDKLIETLQNIYIGSHQDWIDANLGPAAFSYYTEELLECVYLTDPAIVRVYYDPDALSCLAYFITKTSDDRQDKLLLPEPYTNLVDREPLGKFSYYDIVGAPATISSYHSNGDARTFYIESYYYGGGGNYYSFYFASMDYGVKESWDAFLSEFAVLSDGYQISDEELEYTTLLHGSFLFVEDRTKTCPNTYGVSTLTEEETIGLISDYKVFDSLRLRGESDYMSS